MTLHPWPLNDIEDARQGAGDPAAVLWTGHRGRGLLSDSLAVPLRFMPEAANPAPAAQVAPRTVDASPDVFDSSALLRLRDIGCRFGSGG